MKKILTLTALTLCMASNAFADGCMTLKNTSWHGQVKLDNVTVVPVNVRINQVVDNHGTHNITGTINGEALDGRIACMEWDKNTIHHLSLRSTHYWVSSYAFSPNGKNPNRMSDVMGAINNVGIDGFDKSESYLIKG